MLLQKFAFKVRIVVAGSTPTSNHLLHFLPNSWCRFISSTSNTDFTVDYLINSCGLSPESALKASKSIQLKSPTRPDSVLSLFKSFHISKPHISKLVALCPRVLLSHPDTTLKPKLEFFNNLGISGPELGEFISSNTSSMTASLDKRIIPFLDLCKSLVHTDSSVLKILCQQSRRIPDAKGTILPNIKLLKDHGVPESNIVDFIMWKPQGLCVKPDRLNKVILELQKLGVSRSRMIFLRCLYVLAGMKKPLWDSKLAVYKSFGWSEDEVLSVFKKQPAFMSMSEDKIISTMNFLVDNLNWTKHDVARHPTVLVLGLEKRLIPRTSVLQILISKGLIKKISVARALIITEDSFLEKFIMKYHHEVPELLKLYQSKIRRQPKIKVY